MKKSFILPIMAGTLAFAISCGPKLRKPPTLSLRNIPTSLTFLISPTSSTNITSPPSRPASKPTIRRLTPS